MQWFLARIVYRIICGNGNHKPQFDEQLRLVAATSSIEAFHKATLMGQNGSDTFYNQNRQLVQWEFINIDALHPLENLEDGVELYSSVREVDNAEAFITFVQHKATQLRSMEKEALLKIS